MATPNLSYIRELSGGDQEFESRLIGVLKKELPQEIDRFHKHIRQKNLRKAAEDVHKIKHKMSILGMVESYSLSEKFEDELKREHLNLHGDFVNILQKMIIFLSEF